MHTAHLRIMDKCYAIQLPFEILKKELVKEDVCILCQSESADVLRFTDGGFIAQGEGPEEFLILRNGNTKSVIVNFSDIPQKEIKL